MIQGRGEREGGEDREEGTERKKGGRGRGGEGSGLEEDFIIVGYLGLASRILIDPNVCSLCFVWSNLY